MVALLQPDNRILHTIIQGDCLEVMRPMASNSVDALCCDPPCGIAFMGKSWDSDKGGRKQWIAWLTEVMQEAMRIVKPGGHAFVWALPRTSHWTATALEDAGWEIRDVITHLFGSGFPKSMDISKAIDRMAGKEREVVGPGHWANRGIGINGATFKHETSTMKGRDITSPATPEAQQYSGYGTALKPSSEHWILCRKPLSESTIAANVLKWGTGGLAIDASRVGTQAYSQEQWNKKEQARTTGNTYGVHKPSLTEVPTKRFPSNTLLSHSLFCVEQGCDTSCPVRLLDEQSGMRKSGAISGKQGYVHYNTGVYGKDRPGSKIPREASDGGASRYFQCFPPDDMPPFLYQAKPSRRERNEGCENLPEKTPWTSFDGQYAKGRNPVTGERSEQEYKREQSNHHPTVKSIQLMRYLIRMITPLGGTVLDCFMGSGSTGVACVHEGFTFIGIEQSEEYVNIAHARIAHAEREVQS